MNTVSSNNKQSQLLAKLNRLWKGEQDHFLLEKMIRALDSRYDLIGKMAMEPGVEEIITWVAGRLANSFGRIPPIQGKRILDIACGSISSKATDSLYVNTPFGEMTMGRASKGYTALFEPRFCRILLSWVQTPLGLILVIWITRSSHIIKLTSVK